MSDKGNSTIFFILFSLCIVLFHVNSFASVDITGPRISSVMMRTETVTIGDTITVEATVDDESGIKFGSVQLLNRSLGNTSNAARKHTYFESVGGNRWVATFIVDEDWAEGEYALYEIYFKDIKENDSSLLPYGELSSDFPNVVTVTGTQADISGPDIKQVSFNSKTVTIGDTITVEATVDEESGIKFGYVQLLNRSLGNTSTAARKQVYFESVGGNRWVATFIVDEDWAEGEYALYEIYFKDIKENDSSLLPYGELSSDFPNVVTVSHYWESVILKQSTCSSEGVEIKRCRLCGLDDASTKQTTPKSEHVYNDWIISKEADCSHEGLRAQKCVYCGNSIEEVIPALGHTWSNDYTIDKAASEKEIGLKSIHCLVCDAIKEGSVVVIPAKKADPPIPVEPLVSSISLKANPSTTICAGKKVSIVAKVEPEDAYPAVAWKSSNTKYATVASNGQVVTKKSGIGKTVTITATAKNGSKKSAKIKIKIVKDGVTKITLKASTSMKAGAKQTIKATVNGGKTANKSLKWTSSNKKYATVNSKGVVTALKAGKGKIVTITATATDGTGIKKSVKIKIK